MHKSITKPESREKVAHRKIIYTSFLSMPSHLKRLPHPTQPTILLARLKCGLLYLFKQFLDTSLAIFSRLFRFLYPSDGFQSLRQHADLSAYSLTTRRSNPRNDIKHHPHIRIIADGFGGLYVEEGSLGGRYSRYKTAKTIARVLPLSKIAIKPHRFFIY